MHLNGAGLSFTYMLQTQTAGDEKVTQQIKAATTVRLPMDQLVGALNEHVRFT